MKWLGDWFSEAADIKCTGNGGTIIILYVYYVGAQIDIIVVVTIQMKLVFTFCGFSNVTDR
jgi:hypothetical protein